MDSFTLVFLYFLTVTAIITAVYASLQREANHSLYVILLSLAIAFFALGSLIVLGSQGAETAIMGFRIQHIGQPFVGGIWFLYTLDICGYGVKKKFVVVLLMALPVIMSIGVTAGDPLEVFYSSLSYVQSGTLPYVVGDFTLAYNVGLFHIYGFNLASSIMVIYRLFRPLKLARARLLIHLLTGLLPALIGFAAIFLDIPYKREAISTALCISSIILNLYLLKTGAFRIVAKAKYQLFESVQDGIVIVNKRNEYMDANDRAKLIFPALAKTEKGVPISSVEGFEPVSAYTDDKGYRFTVEKDDAARYYTITRSELLEESRYIGSTFMIYDVTDTVEKEISEKSSRVRSDFLSRMSHEMLTPMNTIVGMTTLAKNATEPERRDNMLDKITDASGQLLGLINGVLDMSDIEDNKLRLISSEFSFSDMIQEITNRVTHEAKNKRQVFTTDIDPSIPVTLIGDERRLSQVIVNLLSNAVKFTPEEGSIQLGVFVQKVEDETITLQIEVLDTGIGISEEQTGKLFLPFEQADGGIDRKFGGAGLGLAVSRYIVKLMDGEIWVDSTPDKGSIFAFTAKLQLKAPIVNDSEPVSLDGKRVLLVEDMEINREIVIALLDGTGLHITCAVNGREALDLFSADPDGFDVIIMDINMPEMDGVEATRRIRALDAPAGAQVPIIAMTANILASEVETYLACGMNDHIGKPVDYDRLLSKLYQHI